MIKFQKRKKLNISVDRMFGLAGFEFVSNLVFQASDFLIMAGALRGRRCGNTRAHTAIAPSNVLSIFRKSITVRSHRLFQEYILCPCRLI